MTMIKQEIIKYIEENIDLDPQELYAAIKKEFHEECNNDVSCLCKAVERTIELYKNHDREVVTDEMHQRLMAKLKSECG